MAEAETQLLQTVTSLYNQATNFVIKSEEDYLNAGELWNALRDLRGEIKDTFQPIIDTTNKAHKEALAQFKKHDNPADAGQRAVKAKMIEYNQEQDRKRKLEQARLDAERKKQAEADALELAAELEKAGLGVAAEQVIETPIEQPQVILPDTKPKVEGFRSRKIWIFDVLDPNLVPREYLVLDLVKIGQVVRALKEATNIPGIQPKEVEV